MLRTRVFSARAPVAIGDGPLALPVSACSVRIRPSDWPRVPALPVSADDASGSAVAYSARVVLVLGVPESAPCP